jgi:hypothetical protein
MNEHDSYRILLTNREKVLKKKICEIIPDLLGDPIPATYGYFFFQEIFLDCQKLLTQLIDCENLLKATLKATRYKKLKRFCEEEIRSQGENPIIVSGGEIEIRSGLETKDLCAVFLDSRSIFLESSLAHIFLFTKNLLNIQGGRMIDATGNDGLHKDLENAKKFYASVKALREWETDKLWDSVWAPLGGHPNEEMLEKIPEEKIPFEIEDIDWTWEWIDNRDEIVHGYLIDIRDLTVHPNETLEELEKRIDNAIKPIKEYLSKKRPNLSQWWG